LLTGVGSSIALTNSRHSHCLINQTFFSRRSIYGGALALMFSASQHRSANKQHKRRRGNGTDLILTALGVIEPRGRAVRLMHRLGED